MPGDGIVPNCCDGALVEYNVMRDCPRLLPEGEAAAGIWPWSCDNTTVQYNEVSDHKAPWDAQGFDSDWNCRNTLIQYNYSHDNEGGFLLICNNGGAKAPRNIGNIGTMVRYNISVNDGLRPHTTRKGRFSPTFHISGPCKDTRIYNNTIVIPRKPSDDMDRTLIEMDNWGGPWPEDTRFANNLFIAEERADIFMGEAVRTTFVKNAFSGSFQNLPAGALAVDVPLAAIPIPGVKQRARLEIIELFRPGANSPLFGAGIAIPENGGLDFSGALLPEKSRPSIGALERTDSNQRGSRSTIRKGLVKESE